MGQSCEGCTSDLTVLEIRTGYKAMDFPDFEHMHVFEFERRVKQYAHPANNGKVSISQIQ